MTIAGWVFMIWSITFVVTLSVWCYIKVLTAPDADASPAEDAPRAP